MIPRNPGPCASRTTLYSHVQFLTLAFSPERKPNTLRQLSRGAGASQPFLRARETDVRKVNSPSIWQLTLASVSPSPRELTRYSSTQARWSVLIRRTTNKFRIARHPTTILCKYDSCKFFLDKA